ncbi:MAG: HIT family protein [Deinococcales bacterium]
MSAHDPACAFCAIVSGDADALVVLQDARTMAFLDRRPLFPGHVLLVPREHIATLTDAPPELMAPLFGQARRLAAAVERAMDAQGSFVAINNTVSQSVPHLHVHIVPRSRGDGLKGFFWPRHGYRDGEHAERVRSAIREALEATEG